MMGKDLLATDYSVDGGYDGHFNKNPNELRYNLYKKYFGSLSFYLELDMVTSDTELFQILI